MRTAAWFVLLMVTSSVVGLSCDCGGGVAGAGESCAVASDCEEGLTCLGGACAKQSTTADAGQVTGEDAGHGKQDAGHDAGVGDAGVDAGHDAGIGDAGADGGVDGGIDAGILLRRFSTYDAAAGISQSQDFKLKYVTGWSAGPRGTGGGLTLKQGQPWGRQGTK